MLTINKTYCISSDDKMIKGLVLDDGYHDKDVVIFYENKGLLKVSLTYFINIHLCVPHHEDYQVRTNYEICLYYDHSS